MDDREPESRIEGREHRQADEKEGTRPGVGEPFDHRASDSALAEILFDRDRRKLGRAETVRLELAAPDELSPVRDGDDEVPPFQPEGIDANPPDESPDSNPVASSRNTDSVVVHSRIIS